jgi:hypothetical protein
MSVSASRAIVESNNSSLRGSPEYLEAFELETWKKQEENRFRLWLKEEEQRRKAELDLVVHEKEEARENEFKAKMKVLHNLESKLRSKLAELEGREQRIASVEAELRRDRKDCDLKVKRLIEEHAAGLKAANEAHNSALKVEAERLRLEALRRHEAEKELERRGKVREALPAELADLHALLKIKEFELAQALERESLMVQSRDHFRNALIASMQPPSSQPPHQLPQAPPSETPSSVLSVSAAAAALETPKTPQSPASSDLDGKLTRLRQQRAELIAGGFPADDRVIVALDQQIYRILNN